MTTAGSGLRRIGFLLLWGTGCSTSPAPSPGAEAASLVPGPGTFAIAARDEVTVHREPGSPVVVNTLYTGEKIYVVDVPAIVEGAAWIRVELRDSAFGWMEFDPAEPPVTPVEPACPAGEADRVLEIREVTALTAAERLYCFGTRTLRIEPVTSRELPTDSLYGGEPDWLADEPALQLHGRGGFSSSDGPLGGHLEPTTVRLEAEAWYSIEGRFDHPASRDCERRVIVDELGVENAAVLEAELPAVVGADAILWCRQQFVVTAISPIAAPQPVAQPRPPPAGGSWRRIPEAPIAGRSEHGAAWTGTELLVWGGRATGGAETGFEFVAAADGAAYDPVTNEWRPLAPAPIGGRSQPGVAWTGQELLVFGGYDAGHEPMTDGAAYDPGDDTWRALPPLPDGLETAVSAWTGSGLILVAVDGSEAAAYDPARDAWRALPDPPLPEDLYTAAATWTGTELVVLGYPDGVSVRAVGVAYDPAADAWRELPESPIIALNATPQPHWTGVEVMVVSRSLRTGIPDSVPPDTTYASFYDPGSDAWRTAAVQQAYQPVGPSVWIGDRLFAGDAIYDLATDTWMAAPPRPEGAWQAPVWTGEEVLLWGGSPGGDFLDRFNDGLAYRPGD